VVVRVAAAAWEAAMTLAACNMSTGIAIVASGCFWGTQYYMKRIPGVTRCEVGYTGGHVDHPTYEQVCGQGTGHYEAARITYDMESVSYETILKMFFETHDPTQWDGQGPDLGPQYRSAIFVANVSERTTAEKLISQLKFKGMDIATRILDQTTFFVAEDGHQDYYDQKGGTPYCHAYKALF